MTTHNAFLRATPAMLSALAKAATPDGLSGWDFGSSTIGAVKKAGLVSPEVLTYEVFGCKKRRTIYRLTDAGRIALAEGR